MIKGAIIRIWQFLFCRRVFYRFNKVIYLLGLRGIGYLNADNFRVSGEEWLLRKILHGQTSVTIFDVGANLGSYSQLIRSVNPLANIYAFEPHPKNFQKLANIAKQENFSAKNLAISDKDGVIKLYDMESADGSPLASVYSEAIEYLHQKKSIVYNVEGVTIDTFCNSNKIDSIDLLKIDTEGHEYQALVGAQKLLAENKIKIIQFEFNEMNVVSRVFMKDFIELLPNFELFILMFDGLRKIERHPLFSEIFGFCNVVAINRENREFFKVLGL